MTHPSTRYVPALVALLVLAAIPVFLHTSGRFDVDECRNTAALLVASRKGGGPASPSTQRGGRTLWLKRASPAGEWAEGTLPVDGLKSTFETMIIRSHDPKKVYHNPDSVLVRGARSEEADVEWIERGSTRIPIHRPRFGGADAGTVAAYLLVYNGKPVTNPYLAQLLAAPRQLITGREPMTLFFVSGQVHPLRMEIAEEAMRDWLFSEWRRYQSICQS